MRDRELRESLGLSAVTAARLAGVNRATIAAYELDEELVKRLDKRAQCSRFYAGLAVFKHELSTQQTDEDAE